MHNSKIAAKKETNYKVAESVRLNTLKSLSLFYFLKDRFLNLVLLDVSTIINVTV